MQSVIVLSRNPALVADLRRELAEYSLVACEDFADFASLSQNQPVAGALVHFDDATLAGHSAGHFLAELDESTENRLVLGLIDPACSTRLRKLAPKVVEECLDLPLNFDRLRMLLGRRQDLEAELDGFWTGMPHKELHGSTHSLVTFTPEMFEILDEIKVAARHEVTVLLIGETGSGKTYLARLIHELSERRDQRFCTVACGALPPDLIESELFGYVKGAFTGADKDREGKFAAAGKGTLLLDEIDALSPEQQAKLLRVIETGEYEPVGSNDTRRSEARLVVASNYNLEDLVKQGTFRTDLYYRLNILSFHLLPLRERPWDVEFLARRFALEHSRSHKIHLRTIEAEFFDVLRRYPWPGNVREMENVIRRAVLYCQKGVLTVNDLPSSIRSGSGYTRPGMSGTLNSGSVSMPLSPHYNGIQPGAPVLHPNIAFKSPVYGEMPPTAGYANQYYAGPPLGNSFFAAGGRPMPGTQFDMSQGQPQAAVATAATAEPSHTLEARVDVMERRIIEDCLRRNNHRRKETAAELGISRVTLYNKMKKFGLL